MMWEELAAFDTTFINVSPLVVTEVLLLLMMLRVHTPRCLGAGYKKKRSVCFVEKIRVLFQLGIY